MLHWPRGRGPEPRQKCSAQAFGKTIQTRKFAAAPNAIGRTSQSATPTDLERLAPFRVTDGRQAHMNVGDEKTQSLWMDTDVAPDAGRLTQDERADTIVIGSGIAGLSTAYELCQEGHSVVVLDRGKIGNGMTARTTAHLA